MGNEVGDESDDGEGNAQMLHPGYRINQIEAEEHAARNDQNLGQEENEVTDRVDGGHAEGVRREQLERLGTALTEAGPEHGHLNVRIPSQILKNGFQSGETALATVVHSFDCLILRIFHGLLHGGQD
uniref:Uncharacterized protein n=1 Tax=Cacopsylla melanoneura TaxID=428564 RepID=A0A8D8XH99_9HEMI